MTAYPGDVVNVAHRIRESLFGALGEVPGGDATGRGDERTGAGPAQMSLDATLEHVLEESFVRLQTDAGRIPELRGNIVATKALVVSVPVLERMLTTVAPAKRGVEIPACTYGAQCRSRQISRTVDGRALDPKDVRPFRVWLRPEEEEAFLRGVRIPSVKYRACAMCYLHEFVPRGCSRREKDTGECTLDYGKAACAPEIVALTCKRWVSEEIAKTMRGGQPADIEQVLDKTLLDDPFDCAHTMRFSLMGSPSPFAIPVLDPGLLMWRVLEEPGVRGGRVLRLQADCGHMRACVSEAVDGLRRFVLRCGDPIMLTTPAPAPAPPTPCASHTPDLRPGLRVSQEAARLRWRALTVPRVFGVDLGCAGCLRYYRERVGRPFPCAHAAYTACFLGTAVENVRYVADVAEITAATLALLAGRSIALPKNYAEKLAGMITWMVRDPGTMDTVQGVLFPLKSDRAKWQPVPVKDEAEMDVGVDDDVPRGTGPPPSPLYLSGQKRRVGCMVPKAIAAIAAKLQRVSLDRVLRVALAYVVRRGLWEYDAALVADSGVLLDVWRTVLGSAHDGRTCCAEHCVCRMRCDELLRRVGHWLDFPVSPTHEEEAAVGLAPELGAPPGVDIPGSMPCLRWVHEQGRAYNEHGPILVMPGPAQLRACHLKRLREVVPTVVFVCPGCGESSVTRAALLTKADKRNKLIGYDMHRQREVCRSNYDDPASVPIPSHGHFMRMFGVWWVLCCMCLQPVMVTRCTAHWSATHVCVRCTTRLRGQIGFKVAMG